MRLGGGPDNAGPPPYFMKIYSYLTILCFIVLSLIPPADFIIINPPHPYWLWMVLIAGFFGFFTLFINTQWPVKVIAVLGFFSCFFSAAPYLSFTSYVSLVACCYFYIVCSQVEDWSLIFKALQAVLLLQLLIVTMQFFNKDPLINFGVFHVEHYGTVGNRMQMGSLAVIISALLACFNKYFLVVPILFALFCNSTWTFLSAGVGLAVYFFHKSHNISAYILVVVGLVFVLWAIKDGKVIQTLDSNSGRITVWQKSIELANQRPFTGWGIGTYKDLFHPLSQMTSVPWRTAHNFIVQFLFETGYLITGCLLLGLGWLFWLLYKHGLWLLLAGLSMIFFDNLVHFADRMMQAVPLIIVFFAYATFSLKRRTYNASLY